MRAPGAGRRPEGQRVLSEPSDKTKGVAPIVAHHVPSYGDGSRYLRR
jgi:hypothetical protein